MKIRYINQDDDRLSISRIYEESWKYAYKDIIPQEFLDSIPTGRWVSNLDKPEMHHLVAIDNDTFIGTSCICKSRFPEFKDYGEIVSIYFLPEYIGKGYGRQMLKAAINELAEMGYNNILLWVLEDNHRAIEFYGKNGFVRCDKYIDDNIGGKPLREIAYCYNIK